MRNIDTKWRNLAEGLLRVEALEAQFRAEWGPRLGEAWRKKNEAKLQGFRERGRAALVAAFAMTLFLFAAAFTLLLVASLEVAATAFVPALLVPVALTIYGVEFLSRTSESLPVPSDLSNRWWSTVSGRASSVRRSGPTLSARHYGDEGEKAFVTYLAGRLSEEYVAVRGLLVSRNLDADVIVTGPNGIWIYEVKHWSGDITCERGEWWRMKTYRERGGRLIREFEVLRPFDKQWLKESSAVKVVLRREFPEYSDPHEAVGGGIVFTHGGFSFRADGSCRARVYTPRSCVETLRISPEITGLTMEKRLRIVDALLEWSDRLHNQQEKVLSVTASSVELAESLHEDAVTRAVSYLSDSDEVPGGATAAVGGSHGGS